MTHSEIPIWFIILIGIVILAIVIGGGVYLYKKKKSTPTYPVAYPEPV